MIRYILFLISLELLVQASFTDVQNYYDNGEYEKAIKEARVSTDEYSKPELHLLWAKSAQKLGHLDEAMSAYERVVMLDESNIDAKVELAKLYEKTKRIVLAKETSKELSNYQLTPEERSALELIEGTDIQNLKVKASLMTGYDSNINISADADKLDDFYQVTNSQGEQSSLFSRFNGSLSYINDFESQNGAYLRSDLKLYYQNNLDEHHYDMFIASIDAGFGYRDGKYNIYAPFGIDKVNYLDTSLFEQYKFEPRIDISINSNYILNLNASYKQRNYSDSIYSSMDDSSISAGLGLYYMIDKNFLYFHTKYESFSAQKSQSALFVDKDMLTTALGVNYNIKQLLTARLDYRYRNASYEDSRDDDYHQLELKLSRFFNKKYELFISNRYADNSSDYVPARYTKNITILGVSVSY